MNSYFSIFMDVVLKRLRFFLRLDLNINHEMWFLGLHNLSVSIFLNFLCVAIFLFASISVFHFFSRIKGGGGGLWGWDVFKKGWREKNRIILQSEEEVNIWKMRGARARLSLKSCTLHPYSRWMTRGCASYFSLLCSGGLGGQWQLLQLFPWGILGAPTCGPVQSCRSPRACQWSYPPVPGTYLG